MSVDGAATGHAMRSLRLLLEAYAGCELPQWDLFASNVRVVRVEPGTVLFSVGEHHPYIYFVQRGLFKAQMPCEGDRLTTVFFPEEGDVLASMSALGSEGVRRVASRGLHPRSESLRAAVAAETVHTVTAIEHSLLLRASYRVIEHLSTQYLQWARLTMTIALMHATTLQADAAWLRSTPEQRYRSLLREHPGLVQRVTQRDLASFLNITDVALSRIVKRVRGDALPTITTQDVGVAPVVLHGSALA
ncbi:MAG: Crp/Fnr family transcriptional regulator [Propionicimonas sp.]|uniref:Crp/Fnr family transcriptional regulator n=1 Tax=Propionicimonas sp. TaxID=1955623 RepID=UPI003D128847